MKSLLVFVTFTVSAFGAPTSAVSQAKQGGNAVGGLVGAVANVNGAVAAKLVDADVAYNNIGNNDLNNANVDILKRTDAAAQGNQGADAQGGLVGAAANVLTGVAVTGVDADVECNEIANNDLNNLNVDVLRRDAVAQGVQQGNANGGLVGAVANVIAAADVEGVDATVAHNNIGNNVGNNANVDVLKRTDAVSQALQGANAVGSLVGAAVNGNVAAAVEGVDATVAHNNIGNNDLNNANVDVLKRTNAVSQAVQGANAVGGLVGAAVNTNVAAAVTGVDATVAHNNILNNDLNNANVDVLKRTDAVAQAVQGANAVGGLVGAAVNGNVAAAVKGVDATVAYNNILNNDLNNANVDVLRR